MCEWTLEDILVLKSNLHLTNKQLTLILPNKSIGDIKYKCKLLGIQKKTPFCKFNPNEIETLTTNKEFNERITGHLLGDGSLHSDISFALRNTKKDYVVELQSFFNSITGRKNKISTIPSYITSINGISTKCKESYRCTFSCTPIFRLLKELWYKERKIVPRTINLTPLVCNRWYCDDGNLYIDQKKGILRITLHTDAFILPDVEFLISLLTISIGIYPKKKLKRTDQYVITITGKDVLLFLDYIKTCPVPSFGYKWDLKTYTKYHANCSSCKQMFQYGAFAPYRKRCDQCIQTHKDGHN